MFSICGMDYLNRTWHTGRGKEKPDIWTKNIWMHFTPTSRTHFHGNTWKQMPDAKSNSIRFIPDAKITPFSELLEHSRKNTFAADCMGLDLKGYQSVPLFLRLSTGPWTWPRLRHSCGLKSKTLSEQKVTDINAQQNSGFGKPKPIKEPFFLSLSSCRSYQGYGSRCKICWL